ncbi:MAG: amidohydrolase family protein [Haloarculaceae archaeon]
MDTAIVDTTLLTFADGSPGIVEDGAVGIAGDELVHVGPASEFDPGDADEVLDGSGLVTIPGLVDAHVHSKHTLLRGGAQDLPEIEWMNRGLGPLAAAATPDDRVAGARLGVLEATLAGATTVGEYADRVGDLVEEVYRPFGTRVVAIETINEVREDRSDLGPRDLYEFDRDRGEAALSRANALFEDYGDDPLVTPMYGPQALDMISPDLLERVHEAARERDARVHMHVAQGEREAIQIEERYGSEETTVSVLDDLGLLGPDLLAAHCHGTTPAERERMVEAGARMVGCPSSIAAIDGIVPPMADYADLGGTVGLGTDQAPGPGHHDMFRETRTAAILSKTDATDPTAMPAWEALSLATAGGARALGIEDRVGTLEVGKRADVITVDTTTPAVAPTVDRPFHTVVPNLVHSATGREVRDVFVGGERVVADREFLPADADAIVAEARERAAALFERGAEEWRAAGSELVEHVDAGRL